MDDCGVHDPSALDIFEDIFPDGFSVSTKTVEHKERGCNAGTCQLPVIPPSCLAPDPTA